MVNYLFVLCIDKVSKCIFDKSDGKKKAIFRSKIALSNSFIKVWATSTLCSHANVAEFLHIV